MSEVTRFITRFFKFAFLGKLDQSNSYIYPVESLEPIPNNSQEPIRNQLITRINWVLMIVCLLSFAFIIVYPLVYPDRSVPEIIQNAFSTTLGWFGGVLGAFFQVEQNKSSS